MEIEIREVVIAVSHLINAVDDADDWTVAQAHLEQSIAALLVAFAELEGE